MRYLVVSDIHANWEALEAVLAHARGKYDQVLCLGDIVGYGADPDVVTEWVRQNAGSVIRGNHDKACAGLEDLEWFNPVARISAVWTMQTTKPQNVEWLSRLPRGPLQVGEFQIIHGSPVDEDEYLLTEQDASQIAPYMEAPLVFFGHTHVQGGFLAHRNGTKRLVRPGPGSDHYDLQLDPDSSYLINPGSVGQPRDNDPRAAFAIYDSDQRTVTYYRVTYDMASAQQKIIEAGLPDVLAKRLEIGA